MGQQNYETRALHLLENLPAESNATIDQFVKAGVNVKTALNLQGLLQLKKKYCNQKKCLNCAIGIKILRQ